MQTIADMTCVVKAATQIRVMNLALFILSHRALNSLSSFIYSKQTYAYVYTHTHTHYSFYMLYLPATPLASRLASLNLLLWMSIIQLPHASLMQGFSTLISYWPFYLTGWLQWHLQCSRKMIFLFISLLNDSCNDVWGKTWQLNNGKQLYIIHPVAFIFVFYINNCCEMRSQALEQRNM